MQAGYIMLLFLLAVGIIWKNMTVAYAVGIVLIIRLTNIDSVVHGFSTHGMNWGVTILTAALLMPLATGDVTSQMMTHSFKSALGIVSLLVGIAVAAMAGRGVGLLYQSPELVTAIMIGTIIGVFFFKGLAVGPLIASGIVYVLMKFITLFK